MITSFKFAAIALLAGASLAQAHPENVPHFKDCGKAGEWVADQYAADSSSITTIVAKAVRANPDCACEIVKSAITASNASKTEVAAIVDAVAQEVPAQMEAAGKCAVAAAPDAAGAVSDVLGKYGASLALNPLDLPGGGQPAVSPQQVQEIKQVYSTPASPSN